MNGSTRRQSGRPDPGTGRPGRCLHALSGEGQRSFHRKPNGNSAAEVERHSGEAFLCGAQNLKTSGNLPQTCTGDINLVELAAGLALTHDALHPGEPLYLREALAAHGVEADHVKIWQTVGKLRRRHGLGDEW